MNQSVSRIIHLANADRPSKTRCGQPRETPLTLLPVDTRIERVTCDMCRNLAEKGRNHG